MNLLYPSSGWSVMSKNIVPSRSSARLRISSIASWWRSSNGGSRSATKGWAEHLGERHVSEQRNQARNEGRILRGLDDQRELHGGSGHFDGRLGALVLGPVHNVGPVNQFCHRSRIKAELRAGNVCQKAGAGGVLGIAELAAGAGRILLAGQKFCWSWG